MVVQNLFISTKSNFSQLTYYESVKVLHQQINAVVHEVNDGLMAGIEEPSS